VTSHLLGGGDSHLRVQPDALALLYESRIVAL
jgi:hypothetical protein